MNGYKGEVDGNIEEFVHVLHTLNDTVPEKNERKWRQSFWQIFPSVCASLFAVPFGIMLGWPSTAYPYLLQETSVIPITLSQSAMIAGFFMLGITTATPFSSKYHVGPKYGIWISLTFLAIGWTMMWYSTSIFWLLGSRFTAGLGGGYGFGQVKAFIKDMCELKLSVLLIKQLNFYGFFGIITAFTMSIFLDFREFSLVALIISLTILFITLFLPSSPKDFIKSNRIDEALTLLNYLRGKKDHTEEIKKIHLQLNENQSTFFVSILKEKILRIRFVKFIFMVFLQQFSGAPTSLVYCQIFFEESGCPFPELCAVVYSIFFFISNVYGTFYLSSFKKRHILIFSSFFSLLMLVLQVLVLYYEVNDMWPYTSLLVMLFFIIFYCIGVGVLPSTYITDWFPKKYHQSMTHIFLMVFYMCALVATKCFQVVISAYSFYVGFFIFITSDFLLLVFALFFLKDNDKNHREFIYGKNQRNIRTNVSSFWKDDIGPSIS